MPTSERGKLQESESANDWINRRQEFLLHVQYYRPVSLCQPFDIIQTHMPIDQLKQGNDFRKKHPGNYMRGLSCRTKCRVSIVLFTNSRYNSGYLFSETDHTSMWSRYVPSHLNRIESVPFGVCFYAANLHPRALTIYAETNW